MAVRMSPRRGKQLARATGGGRWSRRVTGKPERGQSASVLLFLFLLVVAVAGAIAALTWVMDFQLRRGILAQRQEAAARPDWVALEELPTYVPQAFLLVVDPRFRERDALRAGMEPNLARELVREVHLFGEGLWGEARLLVTAPLLEYHLSSQQIVELYLNRVFLGEDEEWQIFGVYHAAREYFNKHPRELTLSEAATLAGLLLPPRLRNPHAWPGAVGARRNEVLRQMLSEGHVTPGDFQLALEEPLHFQAGPEHTPMTRPLGWEREPEVIRVPATLPPAAEPAPQP